MDEMVLAFYHHKELDGRFLGGILVTDGRSVPLEFRYTDPVQPTRLHRVLFGRMLETYLFEEVIQRSLFRELKQIPQMVFVREPSMLSGSVARKIPWGLLAPSSLSSLGPVGTVEHPGGERDLLVQSAFHPAPIKLSLAGGEPDVLSRVETLLRSLAPRMDLLEPFERLGQALDLLVEGEGG